MSITDSKVWWTYIVECSDGSYYTGCTPHLHERIKKHNQGKGAKYTRGRLPVELIFAEKNQDHSAALKREVYIKTLNRVQKEELAKKFHAN